MLFNIPSTGVRTDNHPVMSGNVEIAGVKLPLAAFIKTSQTSGTQYLNLKVDDNTGITHYGFLMANSDKRNSASCDYYGYLDVENNTKKLRIAGWRKESIKSKTTYISLDLKPIGVNDAPDFNELPI